MTVNRPRGAEWGPHLQVQDGGDPLLQEHLPQGVVHVGHALHQLLPAVDGLGAVLRRDLVQSDVLTEPEKGTRSLYNGKNIRKA